MYIDSKQNKRKIVLIKLMSYSLSSLLFAFFIFVLVMSFVRQNVSVEYRLFYIDQQLKYYIPDGTLKNEYYVGKLFSYKSDGNYKNQGKGWNSIGSLGCWTTGLKSDLYFYANNITNNKIKIDFTIEESHEANNTILINDIGTSSLLTYENVSSYTLELDANLFKIDSVNKMSLSRLTDGNNLHVAGIKIYE